MNILYKIALAITIIGAVNWGFVGLFDVNLVSLLFGVDSTITNVVYVLVGICGLISTCILLTPFEDAHHK